MKVVSDPPHNGAGSGTDSRGRFELQEELLNGLRAERDQEVEREGEVGVAEGPQLAHPCFRLTRLVSRGDGDVVALDLLGQMRIVDREVLKIRPLRLFVNEIAAKTKDD